MQFNSFASFSMPRPSWQHIPEGEGHDIKKEAKLLKLISSPMEKMGKKFIQKEIN